MRYHPLYWKINYLFTIAIGFCWLVVLNEFVIHELKCQRRFSNASTTNHNHFVKCRPGGWFFRHVCSGFGCFDPRSYKSAIQEKITDRFRLIKLKTVNKRRHVIDCVHWPYNLHLLQPLWMHCIVIVLEMVLMSEYTSQRTLWRISPADSSVFPF